MIAHFLDSRQSAKSTIYQGIAFWQSNKLVGEPSWSLGGEVVIDGRTKFAKRYTVVVETNDLADYITEDWTGFRPHSYMNNVNKVVMEYVNRMLTTVASEFVEEAKQQVKNTFYEEITQLPPLGKYEVLEAIESITTAHPTARPETISEKRLFGLRDKLNERYDDIPGMDLFNSRAAQSTIDFE